MTEHIPAGFHSITPYFVFKDTRKAIEFYKRAFGAQEQFVMPGPDGLGVMHAQIQIGSSILMMGDEQPQQACKSAETAGGSPISLYLYLEDVDEAFKIALEAGAEVRMPLGDMFWGDRAGTVQDPFGYNWTLATHSKDLTPEEMQEGARAFFCQNDR